MAKNAFTERYNSIAMGRARQRVLISQLVIWVWPTRYAPGRLATQSLMSLFWYKCRLHCIWIKEVNCMNPSQLMHYSYINGKLPKFTCQQIIIQNIFL